jgi:transcriptional regulator of acetoin/glycerol metabolism
VGHTDETTRALVKARDTWLTTGAAEHGVLLRPEIAHSWQRSISSGVDPDASSRVCDTSFKPEGPLWTVGRVVLAKCQQRVAGTTAAVMLADRKGRVLHRVTGDDRLARAFDSRRVVCGASFDESLAGTNAIGSALEVEDTFVVHGGEHFQSALQPFSCAAVPIRHPMTSQLLGALNVACRYGDAQDRLLPFATEAAQEIVRRIYLASSRIERLLLERYLSAERRSGRAVIALNDQIVIGNPAATRILDQIGQGALWENAARVIGRRTGAESTLTLESGATILTTCMPIEDGDSVVGALVELEIVSPRSSRVCQPERDRLPPGLAGRSAAWRSAWDQGRTFRDSALPLLVSGEAGVGKLALVTALFGAEREEGRVRVFEGALQPVDGASAWIQAVRAALPEEGLVVVIRHLEALHDDAAQALGSLIDATQGKGARLVGTLTRGEGIRPAYARLVDRFDVAAVEVPPLRDRAEDLPELLAMLSERHAAGGVPPRWMPEAVQTLSRLDWAANVRQLENVVRRVLATRRTTDIRAKDLPEDVRFQAPRRKLSYIERVELDAIKTALQRARGNKVEAAELLGMSRATLYRKIRSFGVDLDNGAF